MTTAALVFMLFSVCSVVALVVWCYYRVLTEPRPPADRDGEDAERY